MPRDELILTQVRGKFIVRRGGLFHRGARQAVKMYLCRPPANDNCGKRFKIEIMLLNLDRNGQVKPNEPTRLYFLQHISLVVGRFLNISFYVLMVHYKTSFPPAAVGSLVLSEKIKNIGR